MLAGVASTGLTMGTGWYGRAGSSTSLQSADSGRLDRAREGIDLFGDNPIVGVGPGRYTIALAEHGDVAPLPPHNIVLHAAAEAGVVAGAAVALVVVLLTLRYLRTPQGPTGLRESGNTATTAAFVLLVPYFVFDAFPYVFPVGLFLTALWLGLLERSRLP